MNESTMDESSYRFDSVFLRRIWKLQVSSNLIYKEKSI